MLWKTPRAAAGSRSGGSRSAAIGRRLRAVRRRAAPASTQMSVPAATASGRAIHIGTRGRMAEESRKSQYLDMRIASRLRQDLVCGGAFHARGNRRIAIILLPEPPEHGPLVGALANVLLDGVEHALRQLKRVGLAVAGRLRIQHRTSAGIVRRRVGLLVDAEARDHRGARAHRELCDAARYPAPCTEERYG